MTPCQRINQLAALLVPNVSTLQLDLIRKELNQIADEVKELELFHLKIQRNQARPPAAKVVCFPGRVPVHAVGDPA